MYLQLSSFLPDRLLDRPTSFAAAGILVGFAFWAAGSVFSRSLITLTAVAIGTSVGMHLPAWEGWKIDGMGLGVGGALVLGTSGYLLHRTWVGVGLATILAACCGLAVVMVVDPAASLPQLHWNVGLSESLGELWRQLPKSLNPALPIACVIGITAGIASAVFWPKLSIAAMYSLIGTGLIVAMGWVEIHAMQPGWLKMFPQNVAVRVAALLVVAVVGVIVQWQLTPSTTSLPSAGTAEAARKYRHAEVRPRMGTTRVVNA